MGRNPPAAPDAGLSKCELHALADGLLVQSPDAVARCVAFVLAETRQVWDNRARAMMCRRLKHCALEPAQRERLVACIGERLVTGRFSEQFKDQLRLAVRLDPRAILVVCRGCAKSARPHVRRYAAWLLAHHLAGMQGAGKRAWHATAVSRDGPGSGGGAK